MENKTLQEFSLMENLPQGFACHRVVADREGNPLDFTFTYVNPAFEAMTGILRHTAVGENLTDVLPEFPRSAFHWLNTYKKVAHTGESIRCEIYFENLDCRYQVTAYSPKPGFFATLFWNAAKESLISKTMLEELQHQHRFQNMISGISSSFVSLDPEQVHSAINNALKLCGDFFRLDRSYVFLFSSDGKTMDNTYEWCAANIEPQMSRMKKSPIAAFPWWSQLLLAKEIVHIPDISRLPPAAAAEKEEFQRQGIKSLLNIPFIEDEKVFGFIGFDSVTNGRLWGDNEISLLKITAESIANTLIKHKMEILVRKNEERYRTFINNLPVGVYRSTPGKEGTFLMANPAFRKMLGIDSEEDMKGMRACEMYYDTRDREIAAEKVLKEGGYASLELKLKKKDGTPIWCSDTTQLICDDKGNPLYYDCIVEDITERKQYEKKLKFMSYHDQLTGLHNRAFFEYELSRLQKSRQYPVSIISSDMDGLKFVNDSMGHHKGDELLKRYASVLKESLRASDILARVGGDEFLILLPRTGEEEAKKVVLRIGFQVERHNRNKMQVPLSISVGLATAKDSSMSLEEMVNEADRRMYRNKYQKSNAAREQIIQAMMRISGSKKPPLLKDLQAATKPKRDLLHNTIPG